MYVYIKEFKVSSNLTQNLTFIYIYTYILYFSICRSEMGTTILLIVVLFLVEMFLPYKVVGNMNNVQN